jgi:hypothetical protein
MQLDVWHVVGFSDNGSFPPEICPCHKKPENSPLLILPFESVRNPDVQRLP